MATDTRVGFRTHAKMKLDFFDRAVVSHLQPVTRRFLNRVGAAIRLTARRSLRPAPQRPLDDLTSKEFAYYQGWVRDYRAGKTPLKPRRPEKTAPEGNPPLLHMKPKSLLRERLLYAYDYDSGRNSVVVGPERNRSFSLERLEENNPFMRPALAAMRPRFPQYLQQAAR